MGLIFEPVAAQPATTPLRADVACFVGFVARRRERALTPALRAQLGAAGWLDGPWAKPAAQVEDLLGVPLVIDSWHVFDRWYAWDERPLHDASPLRCASYLGAAVRSFFARGGQRAIVLRVGDPPPCIEPAGVREAQRPARLAQLLPLLDPAAAPTVAHDPSSWRGSEHLLGLTDASQLLLPDLPDLCAAPPAAVPAAVDPSPAPEGFVVCDTPAAAVPDEPGRRLQAPRCDHAGHRAWQQALAAARDWLARHRRDVHLVAALPLPATGTRADDGTSATRDPLGYLLRLGTLADPQSASGQRRDADALCQLGWPWLRHADSTDLPGLLEPPDGALAGLIAATALTRGCFRSAAGASSLPWLRDLQGGEPLPSWGLDAQHPVAQLARRVCVFAPSPAGWMLQSDATSAADASWRQGGASRLIAALLRAARQIGEIHAFEPNGPALWNRLERHLDDLLQRWWQAGAFAGTTSADAWSVRCDASTMTQADLDAGRLLAEIRVRPAASIETITVVLNLGQAGAAGALRQAA